MDQRDLTLEGERSGKSIVKSCIHRNEGYPFLDLRIHNQFSRFHIRSDQPKFGTEVVNYRRPSSKVESGGVKEVDILSLPSP